MSDSAPERPRAYRVTEAPIPVSASTLYRWEGRGLIRLVRVGGLTLITDEEVDRILSGAFKLPKNTLPPGPKPKRGRPRKSKP